NDEHQAIEGSALDYLIDRFEISYSPKCQRFMWGIVAAGYAAEAGFMCFKREEGSGGRLRGRGGGGVWDLGGSLAKEGSSCAVAGARHQWHAVYRGKQIS